MGLRNWLRREGKVGGEGGGELWLGHRFLVHVGSVDILGTK